MIWMNAICTIASYIPLKEKTGRSDIRYKIEKDNGMR